MPRAGSCCQADICGIPCPATHPKPPSGFGIGIGIMIAFFCAIGLAAFYFVGGKAENFFVAGRSLPLFVVTLTLASQSIDSNALLGNADLSYKYHFYDGAVLPIGLGLSLILNGIFLAHKVNEELVLTLPDIYGKKYGKVVEIVTSLCTCCSFTCLLAGNLVGMGVILSYIFDISEVGAVFLSGIICLAYTACGGLFSVAYTDVVQAAIGMIGCLSVAYWLISNAKEEAPPPSIGMPKMASFTTVTSGTVGNQDIGMYMYPDDATAAMYDGVDCEFNPGVKCYNTAKWCPSDDNCVADNGAYPLGDKRIFENQMSDPAALTPFPNAILFNWATIFVLGFGNLAALDFQARCMAARTPLQARIGCILGGLLTFFVGIPFAYLGAITRYYYGPDSKYAEFEADTCSTILDLPTCAAWKPDPKAFIKLLTTEPPAFLGAWGLLGIVAASMSTSDGAILALGTVFSHNVVRHFVEFDDTKLLMISRIVTVPFAFIAMAIARHRLPAHRRLRHRARGLHRAPVRGLLLALRQAQPQRGALRRRRRYPPPRHPRGVPAQGRLAPPPLCQEGVLRLRCPRGDHDHREGWIRRYPLPHLVRCSRRRAVEPRFLRPGEVRGLHRRRLARVAAVLPRHVPPRLRHREGEGLAPLRLRRVVHALQQEDQRG